MTEHLGMLFISALRFWVKEWVDSDDYGELSLLLFQKGEWPGAAWS